MIRSPRSAHDFFPAGDGAGSRAGRDFNGTTSTSASVKSLWTTFTFSRESSTCTGVILRFAAGGAAPKIEAGFNLLTQVVARAVAPQAATTGIFSVLAQGSASFLAGAPVAGADAFGGSSVVADAAGLVNGFLGETNCGR